MESRVQVVPLWADRNAASTASAHDFRAEWGLAGKKVVLYSGNLGLTHPVDWFLSFARKLAQHDDWRLVVVGSGPRLEALREQSRALGNVLVKDPVPRDDVPALFSIATWGCVLLEETASKASVPSKAFNLLAAGVPLLAITGEDSEISRLVHEHGAGLCFSPDAIDAAVSRITAMDDPAYQALAANARRCADQFTPAHAERFAAGCCGA